MDTARLSKLLSQYDELQPGRGEVDHPHARATMLAELSTGRFSLKRTVDADKYVEALNELRHLRGILSDARALVERAKCDHDELIVQLSRELDALSDCTTPGESRRDEALAELNIAVGEIFSLQDRLRRIADSLREGRQVRCHDCNSVLEYTRSGWETTQHNAYNCDGCSEKADVDSSHKVNCICWACLVEHEECSACREAATARACEQSSPVMIKISSTSVRPTYLMPVDD